MMPEDNGRVPADCDSVAHLVVAVDALVDGSGLFVDDAAHHHLSRVLRVRNGEVVTLTDGRGRWVECVVGSGFASGQLERVSHVRTMPTLVRPTEIAFALTKSDKPEWVVQKLTEIGVSNIMLLVAERSVVRWDADKTAKNLARFGAIAREAVQQSRQVWLPSIGFCPTVASYVTQRQANDSWTVARCDRGGEGLLAWRARRSPEGRRGVSVAIGPEGGWGPEEREALRESVSLGNSVLRAETAAVVAATLVALPD